MYLDVSKTNQNWQCFVSNIRKISSKERQLKLMQKNEYEIVAYEIV